MTWPKVWDACLRVIAALAVAVIAFGLAALAASSAGAEWCQRTQVQDWHRAIVTLTFAGFGIRLVARGRMEPRVRFLGLMFLLVAGFYAQPPMPALSSVLPDGMTWITDTVGALKLGAFLPAVVWLFFRDFPRALVSPRNARALNIWIASLWVMGGILIVANAAIAVSPTLGAFRAWCGAAPELGPLATLDANHPTSVYWALVFGPIAPVVPFILVRLRRSPEDERRRIRLFAIGIVVAAVPPLAIAIVPALVPPLASFIYTDTFRTVVLPVNLLALLGMAAITAYSVTVQHILGVFVLLRQAAQYWLARAIATLLLLMPFGLLIALLFERRELPIAQLLVEEDAAYALTLLVAGIVALAIRQRVRPLVDRLFFREAHDASRIFSEAAAAMRAAASTSDLVGILTAAIERALHPESIGLAAREVDGRGYQPLAGAIRRLVDGSGLTTLLAGTQDPLLVDLLKPNDKVRALSAADRIWLADAGAALVLPLPSATPDSSLGLVGVVVLGPKRSELDYSADDHALLAALTGAAGAGLESRLMRESSGFSDMTASDDAPALECTQCGRIQSEGADSCPSCGGALRPAVLPEKLLNKFVVRRRLGAGAMGVVYLADDVSLDRKVALKTLPRTTPEDTQRLRREARAMAAITDPNLAIIHGAEMWHGFPILVLEYLAGGTLAEQLADGPLSCDEMLVLAATLARLLDRTHGAGILHRDIKPTNIGFTDTDTPKLLDFGLARITGDRGAAGGGEMRLSGPAGTPLYMAPEAFTDARPEPGHDLWSLAVVLFEIYCGRHPFERPSAEESYASIAQGWTLETEAMLPVEDVELREFFAHVLAADRDRRPMTAADFARAVDRVEKRR
ncbi:MAG: protein kinase [Pseudomonadota bacterium]